MLVHRLAAPLILLLMSACETTNDGAADVTTPGDDPSPSRSVRPASDPQARVRLVYDAVLRRFLTSDDPRGGPSEASTGMYVVDHAVASAADPMATGGGTSTVISKAVQRGITRDLADVARVRWVDSRDDVIAAKAPCPHVRGGSLVVTLGPVPHEGGRVEVGLGGYAACLSGAWLTYVVTSNATDWTVSATTGPVAIS